VPIFASEKYQRPNANTRIHNYFNILHSKPAITPYCPVGVKTSASAVIPTFTIAELVSDVMLGKICEFLQSSD